MKKWISAGLILAMSAALFGCGYKNEYGVDPDDYVTLGDYKNITVDVNYYDYTDEELKQYAEMDLDYFVSSYDLYDYTPTAKKVVSENDIVNIDYIGTLDGVAFEGGTAEGAHLKIGSHSYIDGFEDGLIGVAVGDDIDLNLTFPENYNEELGGKDVVFSVKVNSIDEAVAPEYNEDFFAGYYGVEGVTNVAEYTEHIRTSIENEKNERNDGVLADAIWSKVQDSCEVSELPQKMVDQRKAEIDEELQTYATENGIDTQTALEYLGHEDDYEQFKQETAESAVREELIYEAIAKAEKIDISEDGIKALIKKDYEKYGYPNAEGMLEDLDGTYGSYMRSYLRLQMVLDVLKGYATVNELETISLLGYSMY